MMDISNRTLAMFLIAAMVISLAGTLISLNRINKMGGLTGFASSDVGNVSLFVNTTQSLIFTVSTINFGTGTVNQTSQYCNLTSDASTPIRPWCEGFQAATGLVLENNGNVNLSVQLASSVDVNSTSFLQGGPNAYFKWAITNNESGSCNTALSYAAYSNVNTTAPGTMVCTDLNWSGSDTLLINVSLGIDVTKVGSIGGQRNATFTATGTKA
jgi:hypothetical protein